MSKSNDQLLVWGWNSNGQLGRNIEQSITSPSTPTRNDFTSKSVSLGLTHSLVLSNKKKVYSCGKYANGRLGRNSYNVSNSSIYQDVFVRSALDVNLPALKVVRIACGGAHSAIVTDKGELYTFGKGDDGQLGLGDYKDQDSPNKVNYITGTVQLIACGTDHTVFSNNDGTVYVMGSNSNRQLGIDVESKDNKINLPTINPHINKPLEDLEFRYSNIESISCGQQYTVIVKNGHLYSWGLNSVGQCGLSKKQNELVKYPTLVKVYPEQGSSKTNDFIFIQAACGTEHTMALTNDGILFGFGSSKCGQLSQGLSNILDIDTSTPIRIGESLYNEFVTQVACGAYHCLALSEDGHIYSWGLNDFGQCGNGSSGGSNITLPYRIRLPDGDPIAQISAGGRSSMALRYSPSIITIRDSKYSIELIGMFNKAYNNQETYNDCNIKFDDKTIKAHRIILSRSSVFNDYNNLDQNHLNGDIVNINIDALDLSTFFSSKKEIHPLMLSLYKDNIYDTTNTLSNHLFGFVNNPRFSDVTIKVISPEDGSTTHFYAHKCILVTRSLKFKKLFESSFSEVVNNQITITEVTPAAYYTFLHYLYTDKLDINEDNVIELYDLSHKEIQERMIELIENYLHANIDEENVSSIFQVSSSLNIEQTSPLEEQCIYFIAKFFKGVSQTESYINLPQELKQKIALHSSTARINNNNNEKSKGKEKCIIC